MVKDRHHQALVRQGHGTADIDDPKYMAIEMTTPNTLPWVLPWYAQFDINTPQDWMIAEKIFSEVMLKGGEDGKSRY